MSNEDRALRKLAIERTLLANHARYLALVAQRERDFNSVDLHALTDARRGDTRLVYEYRNLGGDIRALNKQMRQP